MSAVTEVPPTEEPETITVRTVETHKPGTRKKASVTATLYLVKPDFIELKAVNSQDEGVDERVVTTFNCFPGVTYLGEDVGIVPTINYVLVFRWVRDNDSSECVFPGYLEAVEAVKDKDRDYFPAYGAVLETLSVIDAAEVYRRLYKNRKGPAAHCPNERLAAEALYGIKQELGGRYEGCMTTEQQRTQKVRIPTTTSPL